MSYSFISSFAGTGFTTVQTIFFIIATVIAANIGLSAFNSFCRRSIGEAGNSVAGIFFGAISVLYSLILAFVIVAEWDDYNNLNATVASESDKLNSILSHSSTLPDTLKATIHDALAVYCNQVITQEWTAEKSNAVEHPSAIPSLRRLLLTTKPANNMQASTLKVLDEDLSAISDLRRERLSHTHSQLPPLVWLVLEAGAVLLVIFSFFINVASTGLQRVYVSFFVCLMAMCFCIIYNLDRPFAAGSGIDNTPYQRLLLELPDYYTAHRN